MICPPYNLVACFFIMAPSCINQGWCCFAFDMWEKVIHMLDPMGPNQNIRMKLHVANVLKQALVQCATEFFDNWHVPAEPWKLKFQSFQLNQQPSFARELV